MNNCIDCLKAFENPNPNLCPECTRVRFPARNTITISHNLDDIIELLEQLVRVNQDAAEQAELATHRSGCKCGRC